MRIGAIADDLTGATDLALMLSRSGARVLQSVGVPDEPISFQDADAIVVSLKTRTVPAKQAIEQSLAAARALLEAGAEQIFFKYCSTFDSTDEGNIGPVIEALLDLLGETHTIACPAFPHNGRTVYMGHLFVGDKLLSESSMKDHPLTPMRDANLVRVLSRQMERPISLISRAMVRSAPDELKAAFDMTEGVAIVDAVDEEDLLRIGAAVRSMRLITGGSGIAMGLVPRTAWSSSGSKAQNLAVTPGPSVILAGSCSVMTRKQVQVAKAAGLPALQIVPEDLVSGKMRLDDAVEFARSAAQTMIPLIYSSADPADVAMAQEKMGRGNAGDLIEEFIGKLSRRLFDEGFTRFIVAGGETSGAVVNALGAKTLAIGPEIDPGVPWTTCRDGDRSIALALKSGNFGAEDFFLKAWKLVQ